MVCRWVLRVASHTEFSVIVINMAFRVRAFIIIILFLFHLFEYFQMRLRLLNERPAVHVLSTHIVFGVLVYFFLVVEDILYLFAGEFRVRVLFIKVLSSETRLRWPCSLGQDISPID